MVLAHRRSQLGCYLGQVWGFCKPQTNEVTVRFHQLTGFRQGNRSVDEWYNPVQSQVSLAKHPPETASILHQDIFFVPKTINDSNIDLEKFPASKVRQLAKKMESSKSTARHIKQVAGDPQAAQVNLMSDLPPSKSKQKQHSHKSRSKSHKMYSSEHNHNIPHHKKKFDQSQTHQRKHTYSKVCDSKYIEGFKYPARKFQCKTCNKYGHFSRLCYKKKVSFQVMNAQDTSVASGSSVYTRRFNMWPDKWSDLQWWIILS